MITREGHQKIYGKIILSTGERIENINFTYVLPTVNLELKNTNNNLELNFTGETEISGTQVNLISTMNLTDATGTTLDSINTVNDKILAYMTLAQQQ